VNMARIQLWTPLKGKNFRSIWVGQTLSDLANWLDFIALTALIVYKWGYGAIEIAALSVCMGLPWVIVGPLMSVRASRLPGKYVLICCDGVRALVMLGLIWVPSLEALLILVLIKMSASAIFDPVRQTAIKKLVETEQLAQAASLSQMSVNMTKIAAPAIGGVLIGWYGMWSPFAVGALLYAGSAIVLSLLPVWRNDVNHEAAMPRLFGGLRASWRHIANRPSLRAGVMYVVAMFFLIFLYDGLFVILAKEAGMEESMYGFMIGAVGAGSVMGAAAAGQWSGWQRNPLARMTAAGSMAGAFIAAAGMAAIGWLPNMPWIWIMLCACLGFVGAHSAAPFGYLLQTETADESIGPVSALVSAFQTSSMLIAPVMGAFAAALWSAGTVFILTGIVTSGMAVLFRKVTAPLGSNREKSNSVRF